MGYEWKFYRPISNLTVKVGIEYTPTTTTTTIEKDSKKNHPSWMKDVFFCGVYCSKFYSVLSAYNEPIFTLLHFFVVNIFVFALVLSTNTFTQFTIRFDVNGNYLQPIGLNLSSLRVNEQRSRWKKTVTILSSIHQIKKNKISPQLNFMGLLPLTVCEWMENF